MSMTNRKFRIDGNDYICVTIDTETICQRAETLVKENSKKTEALIDTLRKWLKTAEPGETFETDKFFVSVGLVGSSL